MVTEPRRRVHPRTRKTVRFRIAAICRVFGGMPAPSGFSMGANARMQVEMELVTGATGYVGSRLLRRLAEEGRAVRALARRPDAVEPFEGVEAVSGDLLDGRGLAQALEGCHTAYYLVHSMEPTANG